MPLELQVESVSCRGADSRKLRAENTPVTLFITPGQGRFDITIACPFYRDYMKPTSVGYTLTGFCIAGIADDESYMKTLESSIEEFAQDSAIARVKTRPSDDYDWIAINTATCILKNPK